MSHPYTISLDNDKYRVINDNGLLTFLRHGEPWPAADDLKHAKVVLAMAQRIEDLEVAIGKVLHGTLEPCGDRTPDGLTSFPNAGAWPPLYMWEEILRRALEQK